METKRYLGIDIGSTTFKAVLLGEDGKVERTVYKRTQPVDSGKVACTGHCSGCGACGGGASKRLALEFLKVAGITSFKDVAAIVVTGSQIVEDTRKFIPFDFQVSEVTAHVGPGTRAHRVFLLPFRPSAARTNPKPLRRVGQNPSEPLCQNWPLLPTLHRPLHPFGQFRAL